MRQDITLPFDHLLSLSDRPADEREFCTAAIGAEDEEVLEGLRLLYEKEGMAREQLESRFDRMEKRLERKIYLHNSFSNHLIELNQQLRKAAAIFLIGISFSFLLLRGLSVNIEPSGFQANGPYDLVMGSKVAP